MRWKILAALPVFWAGAACAQRATPDTDDAKKATVEADPGRPIPDDRGGLSGRGGGNPAGTQKTYSSTIGSMIYSQIGTPIGSSLPSKPN